MYSLRDCIRLIVEATNDLQNLHEYISTNPKLYSANRGDDRAHNQDDVFEHFSCSRWWCSACNQFIHLPHTGRFAVGEKLDLDTALDRYEAKVLKETLELLDIINMSNNILMASEAKTPQELQRLKEMLGVSDSDSEKEKESN